MSEQRFTSVTSLLRDGLPKPQITYWALKRAATYAVDACDLWTPLLADDKQGAIDLIKNSPWRESSRAAERGSQMHALAEQINLGQSPDVPDDMQPYVDQYLDFLRTHQPTFLMAEAQVFNVTYSYAGTLDAIVEIAGSTYVMDMKTTDRDPDGEQARPPYPEVALQLCMYAHAEKVALVPTERVQTGRGRYYTYIETLPFEPMPQVDGALALVVSPYDWTLTPVRIDHEVWNAALAVREVARFQADISKRVLGPEIPRPVRGAA